MEFREFNELLMSHVENMTKDVEYLFVVDVDPYSVWNTYLASFPPGTNEIFRERREFDCSCCRQFVKALGNVVAIKDNKVTSIWDFNPNDDKFQPVVTALANKVKSSSVVDFFIPTTRKFGTRESVEILPDGSSYTWSHFFAQVSPSIKKFKELEVGTVRGQMRDTRNVLKRSLEEISGAAVETVRDLIAQKSLYKGEEWNGALTQFAKLQEDYCALSDAECRENYCWSVSAKVGPAIARIKNHSIGVLLSDIAEGMDLDRAVRKYEALVAPTNYKRPKAIFTKKMIADAQKTVDDLGYSNSLGRRHAQLSDISINNILFANRDAAKKMAANVFEELAESVPENVKSFDRVEEISAKDFIDNVLPSVTEMEVLLENKHVPNLVSLIAPKDKESPSMFKWNNGFSWAYSGNITDSMKERVKALGGNVEGDLRFSIQWNDENDNPDDLDAHCWEPTGDHIYFPNKGRRHASSGMLDVDIVDPSGKTAVENIIWTDQSRMSRGEYVLGVHCYSSRGAKSGFSAEVEFDGKIYSFEYKSPLRQDQVVKVASVTYDGEKFTLKELIPSLEANKTVWSVPTNTFHPVSVCMYSPNYWDEQDGIGHRHYFFMLKGCINPESPNGFFNEFLQEDLMKHKRVFEALGAKMRVEESDSQLSGIGFSSTKRASLTCRVKGSFNRTLKVLF
jgi:hypothetical protein